MKEVEGFSKVKVPEDLINDLKKCQKGDSELQKMGIDELVKLALEKYLHNKAGSS